MLCCAVMSDHDIKATAAGMNNPVTASETTDKGGADPVEQPHSLCYSVPAQIVASSTPLTTPTTATAASPPVPVPYRG